MLGIVEGPYSALYLFHGITGSEAESTSGGGSNTGMAFVGAVRSRPPRRLFSSCLHSVLGEGAGLG